MLSTQFRLATRWLSRAAAGTHRYPFPAASELSSVAPRGTSSTAGEGTSELLAEGSNNSIAGLTRHDRVSDPSAWWRSASSIA